MRFIGLAGLVLLATPAFAAETAPAFVGNFADFNTPDWRMRWGIVPDSLTCEVAVGSAPCNWGYANLKSVVDPTAPGGSSLDVRYPAPSGPPSCKCGLGGAQVYQDLKMAGLPNLAASPTIDLKYYYKFPVGFDFGKSTGGKLPGLYGGAPGCGSGGQRCAGAWSARYMWRGGSQSAPRGEVYWYSAGGSGFGDDLGLGSWNWKADGQWHSIEQLLNLTTGKIVIWHDGAMVFSTTQKFPGPVTGIFFSTFHGGHDTGWSPSKETHAQFAQFTLSTDGPQAAVAPPPAADAGVPDTGGESDASVAGTGGSPGSGGTPGTGGAAIAGTGGSGSGATATGGTAAGTGGSASGRGGSPATTDPTPGDAASGCGCRVGANAGTSPAGGALVLVAALGLLARRRRSRR